MSMLHTVPLIPLDFITPINDAHVQCHFPTTSFQLGYKPIHQISYPLFKYPIYAHVNHVNLQVLTSVEVYVF